MADARDFTNDLFRGFCALNRALAAAPRPPVKHRVPALEQRYPPGCPDADWCAGNNVCYWDCCRQIED